MPLSSRTATTRPALARQGVGERCAASGGGGGGERGVGLAERAPAAGSPGCAAPRMTEPADRIAGVWVRARRHDRGLNHYASVSCL